MRKSYRSLALWLIAGMFSITALAQNVIISGSVRNGSSKESVPAVSVTVKGTDQGTYTDENGNFKITVSKFPSTLVFSSIGYENKEVIVTNASQAIAVDLSGTSSLGQEVVIAATRTPQRILEAPVTVERMNSATIRNVAAPNYYESISNLKGVDMHTASLTFRTVTTRGFVSSGNTRLNQLIDGMDNQAPGLNFAVGSVIGPTELDVDNVELLSGASSALYGSGGMNGTLLINSKNPFKYQGLSLNIKQGVNHIDNDRGPISPYYDWGVRYAKAFHNKFAFKAAAQFVNARDWEADDYRNLQRNNVISKLIGGDRFSDPNYDGVNVYGDQVSASMNAVAGSFQSTISSNALSQAFAAFASGGATNNFVTVTNNALAGIPSATALNTYFGQITAFVNAVPGLTPEQRAAYLTGVSGYLPINVAIRNNWYPQGQNVSRTGYEEKYLVDYNTINLKFTAGLNYMITPKIEASFNTYMGTGTTVYTGADRYSLRNLKMAQHKVEVRSKNWFLRGYTTQENAGDSYNATALASLINESWKASTVWFPQYVANYSGYMLSSYQAGVPPDYYNAHLFARSKADSGRLVPGTAAFDATAKSVKTRPIPNGALFLDRTDLWAAEAQLNVSDVAKFSNIVETIIGGNWKQYVLNSKGTLFIDTAGVIKIAEYGGYAQLKKKFWKDIFTVTLAGRYDKHDNFEGRFTPRFTLVGRIAKENFLRFSYQTAYRFPTNQDQYINLNTGTAYLVPMFADILDKIYSIKTNPIYTAESIVAARNSGNTSLLVATSPQTVKPETVESFEVGYRGLIAKRVLVDAYGYTSKYNDFLGRVAVGQSLTGAPSGVLNPFTTRNMSYIQNIDQEIKAYGWGLGIEISLPRTLILYSNIYSDALRDVPANFVTYFNAPHYRVNAGLRADNVYKNFGFNVVMKWQDNTFYEGTFATGTLPYFTWVDAQISYKMPKTKSTFKLGATNIGNSYYRTGFGSPRVGGLYYASYGYNL
jgi:outer membrane receptor protein involved in Fe transport